MDIFNVFVRPASCAFGEVEIQPVTLALVASFQHTDRHCLNDSTTDAEAEVRDSDDDDNAEVADGESEEDDDDYGRI